MQIAAGYWDNRWFGHIFGKQKCPALQCFEKEYGAQETALAKSDVQVNDSPGKLADTGGSQQIDDVGCAGSTEIHTGNTPSSALRGHPVDTTVKKIQDAQHGQDDPHEGFQRTLVFRRCSLRLHLFQGVLFPPPDYFCGAARKVLQ